MLQRLSAIRLNAKLLILTMITGLLPLIAISTYSFNHMESMLINDIHERLDVATKAKKTHLEQYFSTIEHQVETLAMNQMVIDTAKGMSQSFYTVGAENGLTPEVLEQMKTSVDQYYSDIFIKKMTDAKLTTDVNTKLLVQNLPPDSIVQQYYYMSNNPNPVGEKNKLQSTEDQSSYGQQHAKVHPIFNRYLNSFGYYDIFIIHPNNGDILYSVFKEVDFATSLTTGSFASSNIAEAYSKARQLPNGESYIVDFAPYQPSYGAPASFIASPIYDGELLVGVLCFQMPLDNINEVLSDSENIGHTGEMILLGEDGLMRSNSRLKMDTHSVQASFANPTIGHFNDPLLMKAFTQGVVDDTHLTLMDYRDQEVLFQSSMIDLHSFKVQLIAKLDRSEAFQPIQVLRDQIILATVLSMLFIIGVSLTLSRTLSAPIVEVAHRLRELAIGRLDQDVFVDPATDEVGTLKLAYNDLLATLRDIVESTKGYSDSLTSMAGNLLTTAQEQQTGTAEQASAAEETKNLLMMLLESSKEVAQVSQVVFDNAEITQQNASMIATHIDELSHHVDGIGEILSLIKDIAAKSDLLALNAALEGTKAGEAGRGFSLVAMQMQKLAEQVMTSAKNIDALTSDITKSTNASVLATEEATKLATETTRSAHQITFAVQQQQEGTQEASIALDEIAQVASEAAVAAHNVVDTSDALLKLSAELSDSTQKFKL
jgi:methyl-accepting chemotaxis protein